MALLALHLSSRPTHNIDLTLRFAVPHFSQVEPRTRPDSSLLEVDVFIAVAAFLESRFVASVDRGDALFDLLDDSGMAGPFSG